MPALRRRGRAQLRGRVRWAPELQLPGGSIDDLPNQMRPRSEGGVLDGNGMVEVQNCLTEDGEQLRQAEARRAARGAALGGVVGLVDAGQRADNGRAVLVRDKR